MKEYKAYRICWDGERWPNRPDDADFCHYYSNGQYGSVFDPNAPSPTDARDGDWLDVAVDPYIHQHN